MGNGLRRGEAAGDDALLPGSLDNGRFTAFVSGFTTAAAGIAVIDMLLHDGLGGNDLELVDHLSTDLGQGIATLGTHQILTLQTMLDPLGGQIVRNGVQGVLVLLVPLVGRHLGDILLSSLELSKDLGLIEQKTQLLHEGVLTLFRGCAELLMLRKAHCQVGTDTCCSNLAMRPCCSSYSAREMVTVSPVLVWKLSVFFISQLYHISTEKHSISYNFQTRNRLMCLGLVHTQPLHEPTVLLRCQAPGFTVLPWPLEAAGLQPLVQQHETITLPVQGLDSIPSSAAEQEQLVGKWIQVKLLLDKGCQPVDATAQVGVAAGNVHPVSAGEIRQHDFNTRSTASTVAASAPL